MRPYPTNYINYKPITPVYVNNNTPYKNSRYYVYKKINNLPNDTLEVKLDNLITKNKVFNGYYYTTTKYETLYSIAKTYYNNESYYWILAKANNLKDANISVIEPGTTIVVPNISDLQKEGGYFNVI